MPLAAGRAGSFLLLRQKKRTKEKATLHPRPFGVPSLQTIERWLRNSRASALRQSSPNSRPLVFLSALLKGTRQTIHSPDPSP